MFKISTQIWYLFYNVEKFKVKAEVKKLDWEKYDSWSSSHDMFFFKYFCFPHSPHICSPTISATFVIIVYVIIGAKPQQANIIFASWRVDPFGAPFDIQGEGGMEVFWKYTKITQFNKTT